MDDLATWLRAQLDVDENGGKPDQHTAVCWYTQIEFGSEECTCGLLDRVLRDVEAKRKIIDLAGDANSLDLSVEMERGVGPRDEVNDPYCGDQILKTLALSFSDRPGYREKDWRP